MVDKNEKNIGPNPDQPILNDRSKPEERFALYKAAPNDLTRVAPNRAENGYTQWDVHLGGFVGEPNKYTTTIAAMAPVNHPPVLLAQLSYAVDKTGIDAAHLVDKQGHVTATSGADALKQQAADYIRLLSDPNNADKSIVVVGKASYSGHDILDKNGVAHNQNLSVGRSDSTADLLIEEMKKLDPSGQLTSRVIRRAALGDAALNVKTQDEHDLNRTSSILMVPTEILHQEPPVVHVTQKDIDAISRFPYEENRLRLDINYRSSAGQLLKTDFGSLNELLPLRGDFRLETTDMVSPVQLYLDVHKAKDGGLLVDTDAALTYKIGAGNTVNVFADGKPIANLHYSIANGGELKPEDLRLVSRDSHGVDHKAQVHNAYDEQKYLMKMDATTIARVADGMGAGGKTDHVLTAAETKAFMAQEREMVKLMDGAESVEYKNGHLVKHMANNQNVTIDTSGLEFAQKMQNLTGHTKMDAGQLNEFRGQVNRFDDMLKNAGFEKVDSIMASNFIHDASSMLAAPIEKNPVVDTAPKKGGRF